VVPMREQTGTSRELCFQPSRLLPHLVLRKSGDNPWCQCGSKRERAGNPCFQPSRFLPHSQAYPRQDAGGKTAPFRGPLSVVPLSLRPLVSWSLRPVVP